MMIIVRYICVKAWDDGKWMLYMSRLGMTVGGCFICVKAWDGGKYVLHVYAFVCVSRLGMVVNECYMYVNLSRLLASHISK